MGCQYRKSAQSQSTRETFHLVDCDMFGVQMEAMEGTGPTIDINNCVLALFAKERAAELKSYYF